MEQVMDDVEARKGIKLLLLVVLSALMAVALLPYAMAFPSLIVEDDGFFYAEIAKNIAALGASTFDGLHETSGYHLLWMGVMAAASWVLQWISVQPEFLLWGYLTLSLFVISAYSFLFFKTIEARLLVWVLSLMCSLLMEVNLLVLLLLPVYHTLLQRDAGKEGVPFWLYLAMAMVPLVRIDATVMLVVPVAYLFLTERSLALRCALALVAGVVIQLLAMKLIFGDVFSVSSTLKAADMEGSRVLSNLLYRGPDYTLRNLLAIGLLSLAFGLALLQRNWLGVAIVMSVAGFYAAHFIFNHQRHWYFLPVYLPAFYLVSRFWPDSGWWMRIYRPGALVSALTLGIGFGLGYQLSHIPARINSLAFIKQANVTLNDSDVVFQVDGSGWTGFFLDAHLVNGDGLVNSYEYANRLVNGNLDGYLEEIGAGYVLVNKPYADNLVVNIGGLKVAESDLDPVLDTILHSDYQFTQFMLFRIK